MKKMIAKNMFLFRSYHLADLDSDIVLTLHVVDVTTSWSDDFA